LLILLNHLRCALFELPFQKDEKFGGQDVSEYLNFLSDENQAHLSNEKYFWMADQYPAASVSLRSASPQNIILHVEDGVQPRAIGEVDLNSALWMVHPNAVYLHEGQQYFVQDLNLNTHSATLIPVALDYYTEAIQETEVTVLSDLSPSLSTLSGTRPTRRGASVAYGELQVTNQIKGFKKLRWFSNENLGEEGLDLPPSEFQTTGYWLALDEAVVESLRADNLWTNDANDYGPDWKKIREAVRARDNYRCQICGAPESGNRQHDVHHKIPFRQFTRREEANRMENLTTLCPSCHHKAEQNVRMTSGLAGLSFVLSQLAPLFLMCDPNDLGRHTDPTGATFKQPAVVLYDNVPAGIGFSQKLFEMHTELIARAYELVSECDCKDGCPSCVGPGGENGGGGKEETLAILKLIK
jgi:DEAD/DEAH box helicase domain-containing protein